MIPQLCDSLLDAYRDRGQDVSGEMLPGLSRSEIESKTSWFPASLPEPLIQLYCWRNGQLNDAWNTEAVLWFRDMQFTSLERARGEYQSMMESYGPGNSRESEGIELRTSFPFASFNGGWYVIPCAPHDLTPGHAHPVVNVFQGVGAHFYSVEHMLKTCIEWRRASVRADDCWELDHELESEIWRRINPGIFDTAI